MKIEIEPVPTRLKVIAFLIGMALGAALMLGIGVARADDTEPFLPHYIAQLEGKEPVPTNHCPDPKTLADLLIPCDTGVNR